MTHENERSIEVLFILLDVVHIVLGRLPLVHGVEVDTGIIGLDGLEERSQSVLDAAPGQQSTTHTMEGVERTTLDRFAGVGIPFRSFRSFRSFQHHPWLAVRVWVQSTDRRDGVIPTDVDTIAIWRVKRKVCKGARRPESFSRLAHCRERCADADNVDTQIQGRVRRHASRAGTRASGLIQTVLWPNCARGETELSGIGSSVTAQSCLPDQLVPHCARSCCG